MTYKAFCFSGWRTGGAPEVAGFRQIASFLSCLPIRTPVIPLPSVTDVLQHAANRRQGLLAKLAALNGAIALLLCVLVYFVLSASKQTATDQTQAVAENLAAIAKLNIESELGRIDAVLTATADEIERLQAAGLGDDQVLLDVLASRMPLVPGAEASRPFDAEGQVRWGNALPDLSRQHRRPPLFQEGEVQQAGIDPGHQSAALQALQSLDHRPASIHPRAFDGP